MRIVFFALAVTLSSNAFAQDARPGRPYRGLFGSGVSDAEQLLSANASMGGGYDTSVLAEAADAGFGGSTAPVPLPITGEPSSSGFGMFSGGLSYSLSRDHLSATASGTMTGRYYPTLEQGLVQNYFASAGLTYGRDITNRLRFNVGQTVSYQPYSVFSMFPTLRETPFERVVPPDEDFSTIRGSNISLQTTAGLTRQLSRRSTLEVTYSRSQNRYASRTTVNFLSHTAGVRFTRSITRDLGVRVGYGLTLAEYAESADLKNHNIDAGVDYNRELSLSRKTKLAFSTGGSVVSYVGAPQYNVTGSATLTRELGRTWEASASYDRNVGFVETFAAPFVYDAVNVGVTGLISRRLSFNAGAGGAIGNLGLGSVGVQNGFDTSYASAGISTAFNRHTSFGVTYSYYQYMFEDTTLLPTGFQRDMGRHSVSATLSVWAPVFQRTRRANAAR